MAQCRDCGRDYHSPANDMWKQISPSAGGGDGLCFVCMNQRLMSAGLSNVPYQTYQIASGPAFRVGGVKLARHKRSCPRQGH
jgi:hypothetical protein